MKSARPRYILLVENVTLRRPARRISHAKLQPDPSRLAGGSGPIKWFAIGDMALPMASLPAMPVFVPNPAPTRNR